MDNNLCKACSVIEKCVTCDPGNPDPVCTKCDNNFYLDKNLCLECAKVLDGCVTCTPGATDPVCTKCIDKTYTLDGNVCFKCATLPQCSEC